MAAAEMLRPTNSAPMTTYYLQRSEEGRPFIDGTPHEGCKQVKAIEAIEWLDAKQLLGFRLSRIQETLLEGHQDERSKCEIENSPHCLTCKT
jgi:hypothetical protein